MMLLKACPRCTGDIHDSTDQYGRYLECVQCGFNFDLPKHSAQADVTSRHYAAAHEAAA